MAYVNTRTIGIVGTLRDRLTAFFAASQDARARNAVYRQTVRELNQLTERELADLGIHRSSIQKIAHEAAYGR